MPAQRVRDVPADRVAELHDGMGEPARDERVRRAACVGEAIGQSNVLRSNVEREARVKSDDGKSP